MDVLNSDDENQNTNEDGFKENEKLQDTIHTLFEVCNKSKLNNVFPSLYIALCIVLTLPIISSVLRSFSKLKLIKTRLRSTMCEERLESLIMISCEKDIPNNTDEVIVCFSSSNSIEIIDIKIIFTY